MLRLVGWDEKQGRDFIAMTLETLVFEKQDRVGILKLNRPKALNSLNRQVMGELEFFMKNLDNHHLRALILTGEGKAFVAGADIKEMENYSESEALEVAQKGQSVFQLIEDCSCPTVAAVNGFALGGGLELAMSCDFIIASATARLGLPEVSLGLIPGYGGTQRLSRYVGQAVARRMVLTGDMYSPEQTLAWGLVTEVVPPDELMKVSLKVAQALVDRGPLALSLAKQSINKGYNLELSEGLKLEAQLFAKTFTTEDGREGLKAFIEKRKPEFKGQ